jgi:hypothetical protein
LSSNPATCTLPGNIFIQYENGVAPYTLTL